MKNTEFIQKKEVEQSFLLLGIVSLLPWSAILSHLEFFIAYQKDYHSQIIFGNINFFIILTTKKKYTYKALFLFSLWGYMFALITLPISTIYFSSDSGFKICCAIIFINGFCNAVISNSIYGLISFFSLEYVVALGTGQGLSGVLMTIIRYALLLFIDEKKEVKLRSTFIFWYFFFNHIICY